MKSFSMSLKKYKLTLTMRQVILSKYRNREIENTKMTTMYLMNDGKEDNDILCHACRKHIPIDTWVKSRMGRNSHGKAAKIYHEECADRKLKGY